MTLGQCFASLGSQLQNTKDYSALGTNLTGTIGKETTKATKLGSLSREIRAVVPSSKVTPICFSKMLTGGDLPSSPIPLGVQTWPPLLCLFLTQAGQYQVPPICPSQTLARKQVVPGLGGGEVGGKTWEHDSCYFLEATIGHNPDSCLAPHSTRQPLPGSGPQQGTPFPNVSSVIRPQPGSQSTPITVLLQEERSCWIWHLI